MQKRVFQRGGEQISLLGFGCMRLPRKGKESKDIDYDAAEQMIDYAYQQGVNYFDTAYMYHDGESETFLGKALKKYPRESYYLTDKMPGWMAKDLAGAKRIFAEQLERCQTDYFDFYLCHSVGRSGYKEYFEDAGMYDYLLSEKKAGRIRHLGFSFHGEIHQLEEIIRMHDWDVVQIQLNYLDWEVQDAKRQYEIIQEQGLQCIVMEPVRGGNLAQLPESCVEQMKQRDPRRSVASWAIRYAASFDNVLTVLSGMTAMDQVQDNIETIKEFTPLTDADRAFLYDIAKVYLATGTIPCTGCRYCMDCPAGVNIPGVFKVYNDCAEIMVQAAASGEPKAYEKYLEAYAAAMKKLPQTEWAQHCVRCKKCTEHCPQGIPIYKKMEELKQIEQSALQK